MRTKTGCMMEGDCNEVDHLVVEVMAAFEHAAVPAFAVALPLPCVSALVAASPFPFSMPGWP